MKDPYAVLYQKEQDRDRVRQEIQALVAIIPLLSDEELNRQQIPPQSNRALAQPPERPSRSVRSRRRFSQLSSWLSVGRV
jgi:hypothetical protein